jgi:hypothetical protein
MRTSTKWLAPHEAGHIIAALGLKRSVLGLDMFDEGPIEGRVYWGSDGNPETRAVIAVSGLVSECLAGVTSNFNLDKSFAEPRFANDRKSLGDLDFEEAVQESVMQLYRFPDELKRLTAELRKPENQGRRVEAWELLRFAGIFLTTDDEAVVPDYRVDQVIRGEDPHTVWFIGDNSTPRQQELFHRPLILDSAAETSLPRLHFFQK